jgi:hypothetical protein
MKPFASILSVDPSPSYKNEVIYFFGNGTDDGSITTYSWFSDIDGLLYEGNASAFNMSSLSPGIHAISLRVRDDLGVWSDEVSAIIEVVDNSRPLLYILGPENRDMVSGLVTIHGTAWDDVNTFSIEYRVLGGTSGWKVVKGELDRWSIEWDSTKVSNGNRTLEFRSFDGTIYSGTIRLELVVSNDQSLPSLDPEPEKSFLDTWLPLILTILISSMVVGIMLYVVSKRPPKKRKDEGPVDDMPSFRELPLDSSSTLPTERASGSDQQTPESPKRSPATIDSAPVPSSSDDPASSKSVSDPKSEPSSPEPVREESLGEKPIETKHDDSFSRKPDQES